MLDQITFLSDLRRISGWCGVRHDMGRARLNCIVKPLMVWNAVPQAVGYAEINRRKVAIRQLRHESIVSRNI